MNSLTPETWTSFAPFSKGFRMPSTAEEDWTDESRSASLFGDLRKGFHSESFIGPILHSQASKKVAYGSRQTIVGAAADEMTRRTLLEDPDPLEA